MLATVIFLDISRLLKISKLNTYSLKDGVEFLPASLSFSLHSTLSLMALHGMNIPMYGAIKRCTPLVNLILSVMILNKPLPSPLLTFSIALITVGVLVAGLGDLQFDGHAYTMGTLSVFAQAGYLTLVQKSSEQNHKSILEMLYVNSYNTLPIFLTVSMILGEPLQVGEALTAVQPGFCLVFLTLIVSGCVLTWAQFLCAAVCSALTTSMVGVSKSVIQTVVGFFTFGGVQFHPLNILGLVMNIFGGIIYTYIKNMEKNRKSHSQKYSVEDGFNSSDMRNHKRNGRQISLINYEEEEHRTV